VSITHPAVISGGGGGGDTTPPTMVSATLIDSTHVTVVFSEAMGSVTVTGWSFYDSTTLTTMGFDTVTGSGTAWTFHITSGTGVSGDTYTISYAPSTGNTTDTSSNELGVINNASVTNGIGGSGSFATANRLDLWKESGFTVAGGLVTQWDPVGSSGIVFVPSAGEEPAYDSTDDAVVSTGSESLKYTAGFDLAASFSCYFLIKLTGYPSELLSPGNGYVIYMDATSMIVRPSITGGGSPNYQTNTSHISTMSTYKVLTVVVIGGATPSVVYLDGVAVGSFDSSTLSDSRTMEGIFGELGSRLKGKLKRMAIFNVAHDASTVATNSPLLATA
jgi:hypothetical protein